MIAYLLLDQFGKGIPCHDLLVFSVAAYLLDEEWENFRLHLEVVLEDIDCIVEHIAKLVGLSLVQQQLNALKLCQVLRDCKSIYFFFWLRTRRRMRQDAHWRGSDLTKVDLQFMANEIRLSQKCRLCCAAGPELRLTASQPPLITLP